MKANDLRKSNSAELAKQLDGLLKEQFNLRMQRGAGQLSSPSQMRSVRRDIARIKTVLSEMKAGSGK